MVAFALLGAISTITFAFVLSDLIVSHHSDFLALGVAAAAVKALTLLGQEWFSAIAATRVKSQLRGKLISQMRANGSYWMNSQNKSELNLLLTTGLDSLDAYFAKFLPQIVYTALAAPIYVWVIFSQDALSGITVVATMPLIPLFMTFIGWATAKVQSRQLASLTALSSHFVDAIRGLTTLRVFGRANAQVDIMRANSEQHRKRTMRVLSVSFLSGFALELIASLAVALVAVSIGLRLIDGTITFAAGLLVLILAPDAYLPLRMIGANFHASADGVAAIERTFALLDQKTEVSSIRPIKIKPKAGKVIVVTGPSGVGKTTALRALVGPKSAYMAQGSGLIAGTVQNNIVGDKPTDARVLERALQLAALDDVELSTAVGPDFSSLSGGQMQRVAIARTFYRLLTAGCTTLLVDEPIASLDPSRGKRISKSLVLLAAEGFAVVVVSHQSSLIKVASEVLEVHR